MSAKDFYNSGEQGQYNAPQQGQNQQNQQSGMYIQLHSIDSYSI